MQLLHLFLAPALQYPLPQRGTEACDKHIHTDAHGIAGAPAWHRLHAVVHPAVRSEICGLGAIEAVIEAAVVPLDATNNWRPLLLQGIGWITTLAIGLVAVMQH